MQGIYNYIKKRLQYKQLYKQEGKYFTPSQLQWSQWEGNSFLFCWNGRIQQFWLLSICLSLWGYWTPL